MTRSRENRRRDAAVHLSPFALAFIARYGVELFFALLDKIVSTFTNKDQEVSWRDARWASSLS
jgi:hypothetical protein